VKIKQSNPIAILVIHLISSVESRGCAETQQKQPKVSFEVQRQVQLPPHNHFASCQTLVNWFSPRTMGEPPCRYLRHSHSVGATLAVETSVRVRLLDQSIGKENGVCMMQRLPPQAPARNDSASSSQNMKLLRRSKESAG
jgi:hypothetical protein